jgi:ABC-type sugar transport system substrate-binding protein
LALESPLECGPDSDAPLDLIAAQNDVMAMGAKKAVKEFASEADRDLLATFDAPYKQVGRLRFANVAVTS